MIEDEWLCYIGQKKSAEKVNYKLSILSPTEGRFTALGVHVALDLSEINTSDKIAKAKKDFVESVIKFSKLESSQQLDRNYEKMKEHSKLYEIAYNEVKHLKCFYNYAIDDSVIDSDNKKGHIELLAEHASLLFKHSVKLQKIYAEHIFGLGASVLNNESANSIFLQTVSCSNLATTLGKLVKSRGFVGQIIKPSDWAISK